MKFRAAAPALENASQVLPRQARKFFAAGDRAATARTAAAEVHRFRILSKRFRYLLEYFAPCYGAGLLKCLEALKELQATLGALNDCYASRRLLQKVLKAGDPPRRHKKLFAAFADWEAHLLAQFRGEWSGKFCDLAVRRRWERVLGSPQQRLRSGRREASQ